MHSVYRNRQAIPDDHVKVIDGHGAPDLVSPLRSNLFHFGNSCLGDQLVLINYVRDMLGDSRNAHAKQLGHLRLGQTVPRRDGRRASPAHPRRRR